MKYIQMDLTKRSHKKKPIFDNRPLKVDEVIVSSYKKNGYHIELIENVNKKQKTEPTFFDDLATNNNKNKPYFINKIDQIKYNLCPSCKPDEFEDYHIEHNTPNYMDRSVMDCACGRQATLVNVLSHCTHCTCIDPFSRELLLVIETNKIKKKLKKDQIDYNFDLNCLYENT